MRIIAGEFRSRRILPPETDATRPITDRAKQSLFDTLSPELEDAVVLDLFCGTGSLGLEALSRGAKLAVFYELQNSAMKRLRANIASLGVEARSRVVPGDAFRTVQTPPPGLQGSATLVFLDPPYRMVRERADALQGLSRALAEHWMAPDGRLVFRHDSADALELPGFTLQSARKYGGMAIELLGRGAKDEGSTMNDKR